jgi:hypothetical protein
MPYPTRSEASGIWQLNEISRALLGGDWPVSGPFQIEYLVLAGGGGSGATAASRITAAAGGAGGYRTNYTSSAPTPSPKLSGGPSGGSSIEAALTITTGVAYTVTVGGGGAQGSPYPARGVSGSNSVFSTITSIGGGGGGSYPAVFCG